MVHPPPAVRHVAIDEASEAQRLDNFLLKTLKSAPKSLVYRIVREGQVRINGKRAQVSDKLALGDDVRIPPVWLDEVAAKGVPKSAVAKGASFEILFEDDALLAIHKPAGVAVHGGSGINFGVIEQLRAARQPKFLELVHRLDRDTSGVLLLAKKRSALVAMHELLRNGQTDKRYQVLVHGIWPHPPNQAHHVRETLHKYVTDGGERRVATVVDPEDGKESHTIFRLMASNGQRGDYALLEAQLLTGRTHQIRVHLMSQGFPIAGDDKYGDFALNKRLAKAGFKRMFLHAAKLSFIHPLTAQRLTLLAPLPRECTLFLESLA